MNLQLLKGLLQINERSLVKNLPKPLSDYYDKECIYATPDYIYVVGDIPMTLVAHLDIYHDHPPKAIFHDKEQKILWSPQGLGADDRAGVYAILMLVRMGYRPSIILTTGEEVGGEGARKLIRDFKQPLTLTNFIIELDRKGHDEAVYYDCFNEDFERFISLHGFVTDWGTFTDISFIAPAWNIAAVNLSVGYYNEHTKQEYLCYHETEETIAKVAAILEDCGDRKYEYVKGENSWLNEEILRELL